MMRPGSRSKSASLHTVRIEGPDKKGVGARLAQALADRELNMRGLSAATMNKKFVTLIAFDTAADATKAVGVLKRL